MGADGGLTLGKRWMAEIIYRDGTKPLFIAFEEIADLHDIVEMGPNWNLIEQIVITLNLLVPQS